MYISELLNPYISSTSLRSCDQGMLAALRAKLRPKGDRVFATVSHRLWNSLPLMVDSVDEFLKTYLFKLVFGKLFVFMF